MPKRSSGAFPRFMIRLLHAPWPQRAAFGAGLAAVVVALYSSDPHETFDPLSYAALGPFVAIAALLGRRAGGLAAMVATIALLAVFNNSKSDALDLILFVVKWLFVIGVAGFVHDLWLRVAQRDRLRARQLAQEQQRLALALEAGAIGTFEVDLAANSMRLSEKHREIAGWTSDEPMPVATMDSLVVEEDLAALHEARARALSGDGRFHTRIAIRRANDGALRQIETHGQVSFEHGAPVRVFGVTRDITDEALAAAALAEKTRLAEQDRLRAEELARERQRLALALEAGATGAFEVDLVHDKILLSEKLREIWGLTGNAPLRPGELEDLVVEEDRPTRNEARARAGKDDGRYRTRFRIRRASDGAVRWLDTRGQAYFEGGAAIGVLGVTRDITDEMQAAAVLEEKARLAERDRSRANELAREQQRLALALEAGAIGTFEVDLVGDEVRLNEKSRDIWGLAGEAPLRPDELSDLVIAEDRPARDAARLQAMADHGRYRSRFRIRRARDGALRWIDTRGLVSIRNGVATGVIGVARDVTDEMQAAAVLEERARLSEQNRLRANELAREQQRLALALEAGAIGTFEADLPDGETIGNAKWREIMGFAFDARVCARNVDALVIEEDRSRRHEALLRARDPASGGYFAHQYRIRRAGDGALRWIDSRGRLTFRNGEPIHVQGVNRDITEEMVAAASLQEKARLAEQLMLLAEALPGAVYSYVLAANGDRSFSYVSSNVQKLLGFGPALAELDLERLSARVPPDDLASLLEGREFSHRNLTPWRGTFRFDHPERGEIWISGDSQPARRDDGATIWHGYLQDVTARETAARALAESEARVRALRDERLAALERMAARLAHEVKQPLAAGVSLLAVARRRLQAQHARNPSDSGAGDTADVLKKAADQLVRAGHIMSRVREFSRHGEPDKTYRSLHDTLRKTIAGLEADSNFTGFEIEMRFEAERDRVLIDRMQIEEVLVNLLRNARQAALPEGSRTLLVSSRNREKNIEISVVDYGAGLSEDARRHLFELFWTTRSSGMGVGLAMCKAIMEAHYGTIWSQDDNSEATVFTFSLPLVDHAAIAEPLE